MEKENVTIIPSSQTASEIMSFYSDYRDENLSDYMIFKANYSGVVITIYQNKKGKLKAVFSGYKALQEAKKWDIYAEASVKETLPKGWLCKENQIGSDEVGVGDFLLPVTVVAAFVRGRDLKMLEEFGVKDSKKVTDEKIREIAPLLLKKFFVSRLTLDNEHYNELIKEGENLNSIKAKMHNRALLNMFKKFPDTRNIFVDQFVAESKYFAYLNDPKEQKVLKIKDNELIYKEKNKVIKFKKLSNNSIPEIYQEMYSYYDLFVTNEFDLKNLDINKLCERIANVILFYQNMKDEQDMINILFYLLNSLLEFQTLLSNTKKSDD